MDGMGMSKIAIAGLVVSLCWILYDTRRNRKKYAAKERERKAKGGLH